MNFLTSEVIDYMTQFIGDDKDYINFVTINKTTYLVKDLYGGNNQYMERYKKKNYEKKSDVELAKEGDLEGIKWLHKNRSEAFYKKCNELGSKEWTFRNCQMVA